MNLKTALAIVLILLLASAAPLTQGKEGGKFSSSSGCSCHYAGSATVSISGHPASYTAGQTYTLTVSVTGSMSGSGGGFSLDVNKGSLSVGGISISVSVNSAGNSATHQITGNNQRSWTVDWTAPATGSGTVTIGVAGMLTNSNGQNTGDAWGTASYQINEAAVANNPPSASSLQFSSTSPVTTDTLILTYTYNDPDGDSESGTKIRWYKDGALISSRNDQTTVPSSLTSKGESWNVTVTPSDGTDDGTPVDSSNIVVVNSIPFVNSAEITPTDALESDDLSLIHLSSDADNDIVAVSDTEWYVDDSKVSAFDGDTTIPSVAIRDGDVWYAKIRVNDGEVDSDWFTTQNLTIGSDNTPPTMVSVSISGGPFTTTDDIQATAQGNDADNDALTYEWDWPGTMGVSSSTLPSWYTEKGESWTVRCRAFDGVVYSDWMESSAVVIQNTAPVLSSVTIDQDTIYFESEASYTYVASDADGDILTVSEQWTLNDDLLTLSLTVSDDSFAISNSVTDTVLLVNSPPSASYSGSTIQDALTEINPTINTTDANGDDVTLMWSWLRNGFLTSHTGTTIPADSLSPGDIWTALVLPNDGIDDGPQLVVDFTITNTPPIATISSPEIMWIGASATLSATDSTDEDGVIIRALWYRGGTLAHQGMTYTMTSITNGELIEVKVFDDMGDHSSASFLIVGTNPPVAEQIKVNSKDGKVTLTWQGSAEAWDIYSSTEGHVGTTSDNLFIHEPFTTGTHEYLISPIVEGESIEGGDYSSPVEVSDNHIEMNSGPSELLGMIIGIIMILVGGAGVAYSFIPRRD
ncbi:MAG: hypothetical protein QGI21_06980 [Candidatus Poseidoniaceae archaeon]|jgi:hypothetical protein|nr:hypothetical protein [Candidatus Poseidoniaceae archaeon]